MVLSKSSWVDNIGFERVVVRHRIGVGSGKITCCVALLLGVEPLEVKHG